MLARISLVAVVVTGLVWGAAGATIKEDDKAFNDPVAPVAPVVDSTTGEKTMTFQTTGNLIYSMMGFLLGGTLMFVSLFDFTRRPIIDFFDNAFPQSNRRKRDAGVGLEARVASAFDTLAAALQKMEKIAAIGKAI